MWHTFPINVPLGSSTRLLVHLGKAHRLPERAKSVFRVETAGDFIVNSLRSCFLDGVSEKAAVGEPLHAMHRQIHFTASGDTRWTPTGASTTAFCVGRSQQQSS